MTPTPTLSPQMLPVSLIMADRKLTGVYNYTNPGAISHNQILSLYKKYVDPDFTWQNFTVSDGQTLERGRCEYTVKALEGWGPRGVEGRVRVGVRPAWHSASPWLDFAVSGGRRG